MYEFKGNFRNNLITDIDNGNAVEVKAAYFRQGVEDEIITRFYRLWDAVIREVENRRSSSARFYRVDGEDLEMFNMYFPQS